MIIHYQDINLIEANLVIESKFKRTSQEIVLLCLTFGACSAIIPFIFFRFLAGEWFNVIFDIILSCSFLMLGIYIFKTHNVKIARILLVTLSVMALFLTLYLNALDSIAWTYPTLLALFFTVKPNIAVKLCGVCILISVIILYPALDAFSLSIYLVTIIITCVFVYIFADNSAKQEALLIELSRRDPLTGKRNRRAFEDGLDHVVNEKRENAHSTLIILDIDNFKAINDQYGHATGDQVLIKLSNLICNHLRESDYFYRIGGEEFAIILHNTNSENSLNIAENIRKLIANSELVRQQVVTISLGLALYRKNESKEKWFRRTDDALYKAKSSGRNQLCIAD